MNQSAFDPASFLDATISEPSIRRPPLPVGDYTAVIGEVTARAWQGKSDPSKSGIAWDIPLTPEIPAETQVALGLEMATLQLKDSFFLDLTSSGTIDNGPGKNRGLRNYREACDLNKPGDSFSARMMTGKIVKVKVTHEIWNEAPTERISGVAR